MHSYKLIINYFIKASNVVDQPIFSILNLGCDPFTCVSKTCSSNKYSTLVWVYMSGKVVGTAIEGHPWRVDCEVECRWALPIAHDVPDWVVESSNEVNACTVDPVHETCSCGCNNRLRIDRRLAIQAAEGIVSPKEYSILVVSGSAELVCACLRSPIEPLVDESEVVGINDHATVGGASPADEVGSVGKGWIWEGGGQASRVDVLRDESLVRE